MTNQTHDTDFNIGPYRVIRHIAQGGMGAVYEVEDPKRGGRYALKLGSLHKAQGSKLFEIHRVLSAIPHPGIVASHAVGTTPDGRSFQLLDLIDGRPAQVFAKSEGLPGQQARTHAVITVGIHLAEAVDHLHKNQIIHRDIKSANVMVRTDKTACLIDFESALFPHTKTSLGRFVGTYTYAPPEQIRGMALDNRADIYAMGVLLYRMLTGQRPFQADTTESLIQMHLHQVPIEPRLRADGIPTMVNKIIMAMLEKEASNRPATAEQIASALRQA